MEKLWMMMKDGDEGVVDVWPMVMKGVVDDVDKQVVDGDEG